MQLKRNYNKKTPVACPAISEILLSEYLTFCLLAQLHHKTFPAETTEFLSRSTLFFFSLTWDLCPPGETAIFSSALKLSSAGALWWDPLCWCCGALTECLSFCFQEGKKERKSEFGDSAVTVQLQGFLLWDRLSAVALAVLGGLLGVPKQMEKLDIFGLVAFLW